MPESQLSMADSIFIVLVGGTIAFSVWALANSLSWNNRRISLASLLLLMLLMALAFGILTLGARFGDGRTLAP